MIYNMRFIHTSDWHLGRKFHGFDILAQQREVLRALVALAKREEVDAVLLAGDVFDSSMPAADALAVFEEIMGLLHQADIAVIISSGNHDSARRLGFQSQFTKTAGIYVFSELAQISQPVQIKGVNIYGIPYLEPMKVRDNWAGVKTHQDAISQAVMLIMQDAAKYSGAKVVLSHCFTAGVEAAGSELDITVGGLDLVQVRTFKDFDYVALGHIHSAKTLAKHIRYSGAPIYYSVKEANVKRGVWLVDIAETGVCEVSWRDLPILRQITVLEDRISTLLTHPKYQAYRDDWVYVKATDEHQVLDAMRLIQQRFPYCVALEFVNLYRAEAYDYSVEQLAGASEIEVIEEFLKYSIDQELRAEQREIISAAMIELEER